MKTKPPVFDPTMDKIKDIMDGVWSIQGIEEKLINKESQKAVHKSSISESKLLTLQNRLSSSSQSKKAVNRATNFTPFSGAKVLQNKHLISQLKSIDISKLPVPIEPKLKSDTHKRFINENEDKVLIRKK